MATTTTELIKDPRDTLGRKMRMAEEWMPKYRRIDRSASPILYSLIISCERRGIDLLDYLRDVLTRLSIMINQDDISVLLPRKWQTAL